MSFFLVLCRAAFDIWTWEAEKLRKLYSESWRRSDVQMGLKQPRPPIISNANAALQALEEDLRATYAQSAGSGVHTGMDGWKRSFWGMFMELAICAGCVRCK